MDGQPRRDLPRRGQAAARHVDVQQGEVRLLAQSSVDRTRRVFRRGDDLEAAVLTQRRRDVLARRRVVISDKNAHLVYGSTTCTRVPAPRTDSRRELSSDLLSTLAHRDQTVPSDPEAAVGAVAEAVAVVDDPDGERRAREVDAHVACAAVVGRVADGLGDDPHELGADLVADDRSRPAR